MPATPETRVQIDPELKKRLAGLYQSMAQRLGIQAAPKIVFSHDAANAEEPFGKTAYYDPMSRTIRVYMTKRHPTDMLRSFAHELIHHWQNEHGALPGNNAGQEHYAQKDPILRKREMEAYLLGNILFRDWQDENRYGKLNENLEVADPTKVQDAIKKLLFDLIKTNAIRSYHRKTTSGDMNPNDYVDEIARKLSLEVDKFLQVVNNRGNWENQQQMIKETISKDELKNLVRERIQQALEASRGQAKRKRKRKNQGTVTVKPDHESYADWLKKHQSKFLSKQKQDKQRAMAYYTIGFSENNRDHVCWYLDAKKHHIVTAVGNSHQENFGKILPYQAFRGRYDMKTKDLSLTIPEYNSRHFEVTGKVEKDVPPELLRALNAKFPGHKLYYFPFLV